MRNISDNITFDDSRNVCIIDFSKMDFSKVNFANYNKISAMLDIVIEETEKVPKFFMIINLYDRNYLEHIRLNAPEDLADKFDSVLELSLGTDFSYNIWTNPPTFSQEEIDNGDMIPTSRTIEETISVLGI